MLPRLRFAYQHALHELSAQYSNRCSTAVMALGPLFGAHAPADGCAVSAVFGAQAELMQIAVGVLCDGVTRAGWVLALKTCGVRTLVVFGAGVPVHADVDAHALPCLVADHVNLTGDSPLIGPCDESIGPRFPDQSEVYSARCQELVRESGVHLPRCVYGALPLASLEDDHPALAKLGIDFVGPCFVPEAHAARSAGIELLAFMLPTGADWWIRNEPDTAVRRFSGEFQARCDSILAKLKHDLRC